MLESTDKQTQWSPRANIWNHLAFWSIGNKVVTCLIFFSYKNDNVSPVGVHTVANVWRKWHNALQCFFVSLLEQKSPCDKLCSIHNLSRYPGKNRIIISINAKYLLKTEISQFSLILYFITKLWQKGRDYIHLTHILILRVSWVIKNEKWDF